MNFCLVVSSPITFALPALSWKTLFFSFFLFLFVRKKKMRRGDELGFSIYSEVINEARSGFRKTKAFFRRRTSFNLKRFSISLFKYFSGKHFFFQWSLPSNFTRLSNIDFFHAVKWVTEKRWVSFLTLKI